MFEDHYKFYQYYSDMLLKGKGSIGLPSQTIFIFCGVNNCLFFLFIWLVSLFLYN